MEDQIIKFIGKVNKRYPQFFPKNRASFSDGDFAILNFDVYEVLEGDVETNSYGNISIKGYNFPADYNTEKQYVILAKLEKVDPRRGKQWVCLMCTENIDLDDKWQQKVFLQAFLTDSQIQNLYNELKDPFKAIQTADLETLTKVKGIRNTTAEKILSKYESNKDYAEAYIELSAYGLTPHMIKKLSDQYGSAKILVNKIKQNPYILADQVKGIGFKTVDEMALNAGISRFSKTRLEAFIKYILNEGAIQGYSWISSNILINKIEDELDMFSLETIIEVVNEMKEKRILWDGEKGVIALQRYYDLEKDIAKQLLRLKNAESDLKFDGWEERIKQAEKLNGFEYTEEQREAIEMVLNNQVSIITGGAGCVDGETEYFNGYGWIKISDYKEGDKVLQFIPEGKQATLVTPFRYIKEKEDTLYRIKNHSETVDQILSDDHMFAYVTSKGNIQKKKTSEVIEKHNESSLGFSGGILNSFNYLGGEGIDLSNEWIRIMIAVFADGSFNYQATEDWNSYNTCRFHIKKNRKKERLRRLFKDANINWREKESSAKGYTDFYIITPFREKTFPKNWYDCSKKQLEIIYDEFLNWDGSIDEKGRRSYSTTIKSDADFIQFVCSSLGYTSNIKEYDRTGQMRGDYLRKSKEYNVHISKRKFRLTSLKTKRSELKKNIETYTKHDGYKYCFTVPSGYLVLRRNNKIFITGNCGKTSTVLGALKALGNVSFVQCALSGKAAARMEEATGYPASTIHRLLGFDPLNMNTFAHNKDNQLCIDVVVLDEFSMIGGKLFLSLLEAIPNGAKFIMLGDEAQLPAIGALNIASDLTNSPTIKTGFLTKIHRQAAKSAVITDARKVSESEHIIEKDYVGQEIRGELQDLELDICDDSKVIAKKAIKHFKEKMKVCKDIMELQLISPMRMRGGTSVYELNTLAQPLYNPEHPNKKEVYQPLAKDKGYILRQGDKILNVKNNYKMPIAFSDGMGGYYKEYDSEGKELVAQIFNGYTGMIIDILDNIIIAEFHLANAIVMIDLNHWKTEKGIELGYAITCHKSQGSSYDYPICVLDSSHHVMLSREWLYTAMTRSSKYCTIVAENKALRKAVQTTSVQNKQTFLQNLLKELTENKNN